MRRDSFDSHDPGCAGLWAAGAGADTTILSSFSLPHGVAVDPSGNVYVDELGRGRIVRVTLGGVQTTIGSGFNQPNGVAVDASGMST